VIEQVITSIVFIILNLSIYNLVNGNGERKRRIYYFIIAQLLVFTTFLIKFSPEYFFIKNNIFLMMFSWAIFIMVGMARIYKMAILPLFNMIVPQSNFRDRYIYLFGTFLTTTPIWFSIMITIYQLLLIWHLVIFTQLTNSL
jgi:hypothetical protein